MQQLDQSDYHQASQYIISNSVDSNSVERLLLLLESVM
jgi:hypothetical protein